MVLSRADQQSVATHTKTVLVVEDEADVREALREIIEYEGFQVVEAANGKEALDYLRKNTAPCLVLLDLMMPVMNGFDFLAAVKREPTLHQVSVLILSAAARDKLDEAMKDSSAKGYLTKPVQLQPLLAAVKMFC